MLIITGIGTDGNKRYVTCDSASGGYPYWSECLLSARNFNSEEDAIEFLNYNDFTSISKMNDGSIKPPRMFEKAMWDGITIEEIATIPIKHMDFSKVQEEYTTRKKKYEDLKKKIDLV